MTAALIGPDPAAMVLPVRGAAEQDNRAPTVPQNCPSAAQEAGLPAPSHVRAAYWSEEDLRHFPQTATSVIGRQSIPGGFFCSLHLQGGAGLCVRELRSGGGDGSLANKRNPNAGGGGEMIKIRRCDCVGAILFLLVEEGRGLVVTSPAETQEGKMDFPPVLVLLFNTG